MGKILKCSDLHPWEEDVKLQGLTVAEYLVDRANEHAKERDSAFVIHADTGEELRFSEFEGLVSNVASWFFKNGMRRGDVVIYLNRDFFKQVVLHTGIWRANGVVRASYPQDLPETLAERIRESKVKWLYCDLTEVEACRKAIANIEWEVRIIVNADADGCIPLNELLQHKGEVPPLEVTPQDPAMILLTSGTTGPAKGAVRTHERLLCLILSNAKIGWTDSTLFIAGAPHISGSICGPSAVALGIAAICMWVPIPERILQVIDRFKPRMLFGFPVFLVNAITHPNRHKYDLSSVKYIFTAGTLVTPAVFKTLRELENVEGVLTAIGMTEALFLTSFSRFVDKHTLKVLEERKGYEVGKASPGVQLRIVEAETGEVLGPNKPGELQIKALEMITEYLNEPEKTAEAFTSDGFFKTGDTGSYDEAGMFTIYGRSKEVFKCQGNHVSPNQIDAVVGEHPAVLEACTVSVPDPNGDNLPRVFLVLKPGSEASKEEILEFAHAKLPEYMHLRGGLYIVDSLPRGNTGKVTRNLVAQLKPV